MRQQADSSSAGHGAEVARLQALLDASVSLYLPTSPHISPHLPISPYISPHLPISPYISPHLPISPYISQALLDAQAAELLEAGRTSAELEAALQAARFEAETSRRPWG